MKKANLFPPSVFPPSPSLFFSAFFPLPSAFPTFFPHTPLFTFEGRKILWIHRDCGGRESSPVLVTINVLPKCVTSWSGRQNASYLGQVGIYASLVGQLSNCPRTGCGCLICSVFFCGCASLFKLMRI